LILEIIQFLLPLNAAIYGRSVMATFVRVFAQMVTAHGVPQDGLVKFQLCHPD
jgi:hypothetical protein